MITIQIIIELTKIQTLLKIKLLINAFKEFFDPNLFKNDYEI